jgi:hypothetical protein
MVGTWTVRVVFVDVVEVVFVDVVVEVVLMGGGVLMGSKKSGGLPVGLGTQ